VIIVDLEKYAWMVSAENRVAVRRGRRPDVLGDVTHSNRMSGHTAQQTEWRNFAGGVHAVLGWAAQAVWPSAAGPARAEPGWPA
jgi:hypothetical protein